MRIIYMGTPDFAVASLDALVNAGYDIVGVITAPDKPAGRGRKIQQSAVKKYAVEKGLRVLQPTNLKAPDFLEELRSLRSDLQVVVAFRMLPEVVWNMPPRGTFNLHASLLPQYRGAAPINWAIINGEKETGVTTFFLQHEIDTGNILFSEKVKIEDTDNAEILHDKLMVLGASLIVKTVKAIENNEVNPIPQEEIMPENLKSAPKIFKPDCKINWDDTSLSIYNFIRGLSPYPAAWTEFVNEKTTQVISAKIFTAEIDDVELKAGELSTDNKTFIKIGTQDKAINIKELQLSGKKRMPIADLLRGFDAENLKMK